MVQNKKTMIAIYLFLLLLTCVIIIEIYTKLKYGQSYNIHYEITPVFSEENILKVKLRVDNISLTKKYIELYIGDKQISIEYCKDNEDSEIPFEAEEGVLRVPIERKPYVEILYSVKIGYIGKHGYQGKIYDDLVVFDGGQVLLFPLEFYSESEYEIRKNIKSISISCNVPREWEKVIPFERIFSPKWQQLYVLYNSCYALGNFHKKEYKKGQTSFYVYIDSKSEFSFTDETEKGLNALFDYYSSLFGYEVPNYSIVLLRRNPGDKQYIIGGVSAKSIGTTFDPNNPRDWELISHRMFHGFFESKIDSKIFYEPPQLWFYEGLATYYENTSMENLPESLKNRLALKPKELFCMLFKKYIYMKIKYHPLLSFTPMDEEKINESPARTEFLHYTQAPLIIKAIEDISYTETKKHDRILRYIIENKSNDEMLSLKNIVAYILKHKDNMEDFYNNYFLNDEILPLWYLEEGVNEDISHTVEELNSIEYILWSWFRLEYGNYPLYVLNTKNLYKLSGIKEINDVHFAEKDIEEKIKDLSVTVYYSLKEFTLRTEICGVEIFEDPIIKTKLLLNEENVKKWESWLFAQTKD